LRGVTDALLALPLFLLALFGLLHLSEFSATVLAVEQGSFFGARAALVDDRREELGPAAVLWAGTLHRGRAPGAFRFVGARGGVSVRTDGRAPFPLPRALPHALFEIEGRTAIPRRGLR
jgi:hypothetical protein